MDKNLNNVSLEKLKEVNYVPTEYGKLQPEVSNPKKKDTIFLYFTILSASLLHFSGGASFTWASPVLSKIISNDTSVNPYGEPATTIQISMIVGLPVLAGLLGGLFLPILSDIIGRKRTFYLSGALMFLCNVLISFSKSIVLVIVGRSIFFIFFLGLVAVTPTYVTEICENHNRGKFGCLANVFLPFGSLFSYIVGPPFSVKIFTLISAIPLFLFLILFFFTCETPVFLLSKGKEDECLKVLQKLRSNQNYKEIQIGLDEIKNVLKARGNSKKHNILSVFNTKEGRVGLLLASVPASLQFASGAPIIVAFLGPIFGSVSTSISGDTVAIIVGSIKVLSFGLTSMIVERAGRRFLLLFSALSSALCLFVIGLYFYFKHINLPMSPAFQWVPIICIILYVISYAAGMGPLPSTVLGELFTPEFRSAAASFLVTFLSILTFVFTSGFPLVAEYFGLHWCIWIFSINCILGATFMFFLLPETGGQSILAIQEKLKDFKFGFRRPS